MKIEKVYKTSKGTFWSQADAEKNLVDEPVLESFVLIADVPRTSGWGIETVVFELSTVEVK